MGWGGRGPSPPLEKQKQSCDYVAPACTHQHIVCQGPRQVEGHGQQRHLRPAAAPKISQLIGGQPCSPLRSRAPSHRPEGKGGGRGEGSQGEAMVRGLTRGGADGASILWIGAVLEWEPVCQLSMPKTLPGVGRCRPALVHDVAPPLEDHPLTRPGSPARHASST